MEVISQREFRNDSGEVLRRVEAGETVTITRRGVPVADGVQHQDQSGGPSRYVAAERIADALADIPPWHAEVFEEEHADLDRRVDDEWRDPWPSR